MDNQPPVPQSAPPQSRTWEVACHLAALAGVFLPPIGNIVGPLVVWLLKKAESPSVDRHGKESLNFQISMVIYAVAASLILGVLGIVTCGITWILVYVVGIAFYIANIVLPIIAALKASEGGFYEYPFNLRLVK